VRQGTPTMVGAAGFAGRQRAGAGGADPETQGRQGGESHDIGRGTLVAADAPGVGGGGRRVRCDFEDVSRPPFFSLLLFYFYFCVLCVRGKKCQRLCFLSVFHCTTKISAHRKLLSLGLSTLPPYKTRTLVLESPSLTKSTTCHACLLCSGRRAILWYHFALFCVCQAHKRVCRGKSAR